MTKSIQAAEQRRTEVEKYRKQLEDGVAAVRETEGYRRFLDCMSTFHKYSINNVIMIMMQRPQASLVAGFNAWKKLGRSVCKGEKGIRIWAPMKQKIVVETESPEDETSCVAKQRLAGFRLVSVFDISQTDGEPVETGASFMSDEVTGSVGNAQAVMSAVGRVAALPVEVGKVAGSSDGVCDFGAGKITISEGLSDQQRICTLIHETAHSLLHDPQGAGGALSTADKEIEAESVAYIVCRHFGLDSSASSFGYVATYAHKMTDVQYRDRIRAIQQAASDLIEAIEDVLRQTDAA